MQSKSIFIGDIHGMDGLLATALDKIESMTSADAEPPKVVFLGDYVDRGFGSKQCLDLVGAALTKWPLSIALRGNHDQYLLDIVDGVSSRAKTAFWYEKCGGFETCASYEDSGDLDLALATIKSTYAHHIGLIRNAALMYRDGAFVACHAGINKWLSLEEQSPHDLMWISDGFLDRVDATMPPVIHGHTPMGEFPVVTENRISLDTGAHETGRLTFLILDRDASTMAFYQTRGQGVVVQIQPTVHHRGFSSLLDNSDVLLAA